MLDWSQVTDRLATAQQAVQESTYQVRGVDQQHTGQVHSPSGQVYDVAFPTPWGECSCPDYQFGGQLTCKHILIAVLTVWPAEVNRYLEQLRTRYLELHPGANPEDVPPLQLQTDAAENDEGTGWMTSAVPQNDEDEYALYQKSEVPETSTVSPGRLPCAAPGSEVLNQWEQILSGKFRNYDLPAAVLERLITEAVTDTLPYLADQVKLASRQHGSISAALPEIGKLIEGKIVVQLRYLVQRERRSQFQRCEWY